MPLRLLFAVIAFLLSLHQASAAPRGFTCTNLMGGNPYRLTIFDDLAYMFAPFPGSNLGDPGEGKLELAEIGSYYNVLNGPLSKRLKVDTIHIMSPTSLTPSGSEGLGDCTKAK